MHCNNICWVCVGWCFCMRIIFIWHHKLHAHTHTHKYTQTNLWICRGNIKMKITLARFSSRPFSCNDLWYIGSVSVHRSSCDRSSYMNVHVLLFVLMWDIKQMLKLFITFAGKNIVVPSMWHWLAWKTQTRRSHWWWWPLNYGHLYADNVAQT